MVRGAKGALLQNAAPGREEPGHAVNFGHLQGFLKAQGRQHRGHALGQHGLAAARRAKEEKIVPAGGSDFHGPFGVLLPFDVREVQRKGPGLGSIPAGRKRGFGLKRKPAGQKGRRLSEAFHAVDVQPFHHCGLARVGRRDQNAFGLLIPGQDGQRQHPGHGLDLAGQRQFTREEVALRALLGQQPG